MKDARAGKWLEGLKKYRLAALAALLGIVLMLLPGGNAEAEPTAGRPDAEAFDRGAVQEEMENILRAIDGVNANLEAKFAALEKSQLEQLIAEQSARIASLEMDNRMYGVVRYPNGYTYNAGMSPFCGGGCCA